MNFIRELVQKLYYRRLYLKSPQLGTNIRLAKGGYFAKEDQITMGNNIFISSNFHIAAYKLTFGNDIIIGPNLVIECNNHKTNIVGKTMHDVSQDKIYLGVSIEDDVWIGANVVILPGVTVSQGCVVGAGSVVSRTLPPYTICVGVPCRPIKKRFSDDEILEHLNAVSARRYSFDSVIKSWKQWQLK